MAEDVVIVCDPPIHLFFGLSYSNYLVLPRLVLQSMPVGWQEQLIALVEEAAKTYPEAVDRLYRVHPVDERGKRIVDEFNDYRHGRLTPKAG